MQPCHRSSVEKWLRLVTNTAFNITVRVTEHPGFWSKLLPVAISLVLDETDIIQRDVIAYIVMTIFDTDHSFTIMNSQLLVVCTIPMTSFDSVSVGTILAINMFSQYARYSRPNSNSYGVLIYYLASSYSTIYMVWPLTLRLNRGATSYTIQCNTL